MRKIIEGYNGLYEIDTEGNVYSNKQRKERKLKPQRASQSRKGYFQVRLFTKDYPKGRLQYVHRLAYETFVGKIDKGREIDHMDGDTTNNSIENLQLLTPRENKVKSFKGKDIHWREYRDDFIEQYKKLGTYHKVAEVYGINHNVVYRVIRDVFHKKNWDTGKYETIRFNPKLNDDWTKGKKQNLQNRKRGDNGRFKK